MSRVDVYSIVSEISEEFERDMRGEFRDIVLDNIWRDWQDRVDEPLPGPVWCRTTQDPPIFARSIPRVFGDERPWYLVASGPAIRR